MTDRCANCGWRLPNRGGAAAPATVKPAVVAPIEPIGGSTGPDPALATGPERDETHLIELRGEIDGLQAELQIARAGRDRAQRELRALQAAEKTRLAATERAKRGVKLPPGRPRAVPPKVERRIRGWAAEGLGAHAIATRLNREQTPTVGGGVRWYPSTVHRVLSRSAH